MSYRQTLLGVFVCLIWQLAGPVPTNAQGRAMSTLLEEGYASTTEFQHVPTLAGKLFLKKNSSYALCLASIPGNFFKKVPVMNSACYLLQDMERASGDLAKDEAETRRQRIAREREFGKCGTADCDANCRLNCLYECAYSPGMSHCR